MTAGVVESESVEPHVFSWSRSRVIKTAAGGVVFSIEVYRSSASADFCMNFDIHNI